MEEIMKEFSKLTPEEREIIDSFAFAQHLLEKGGDVERRFALISIDNLWELTLRTYLRKRGRSKKEVDEIRDWEKIFDECIKLGLEIDVDIKKDYFEIHNQRNAIFHGKTVMLPTMRDLIAWSKTLSLLIHKVTGIDPFEYFKKGLYERITLSPEDLEYVNQLEKCFKKKSPYIPKLTWWSEIQRDVVGAGEKWDLYIHYRPRWPFFIPTLILVKCNQYNRPVDKDYFLGLESRAILLKEEKKVWRVWVGVISSSGFSKSTIESIEAYEKKGVGMVLINPKSREYYSSSSKQCKKALKWLLLQGWEWT